nr:DUF2939 domain-containing protein [Brevundimonas lenta]
MLAAIVLAAISFFLAPGVAFFAIRSAADANDAAALARLVDYPAVRQSLRPQLTGNPASQSPPPSFLEDPIGAVRRQFEQGPMLGPDPNVYLTPAAIGALTRGEGRYASQRTAAAVDAHNPIPTPVFWSINRARMQVRDEGGSETIFTFERTGPFDWRLVHIGLPDGAAPAVAPAVPPVPRVMKSGKTGG